MEPNDFTPSGLAIPKWLLAAVCFSRALLFFAVLRNPTFGLEGDSSKYLGLAKGFWSLHAFQLPGTLSPESVFPPGYPLFLAPFVGVWEFPLVPIFLVQCLLSIATVMLAWKWLNMIMRRDQAIVGILFFAFDWVLCAHCVLILADCVMLFFLAAAVVVTQQTIDSPKPGNAVSSGFLWGLASMIKPVNVYLPLLFGFLRFSQKYIALFLVAAYLLPAMWTLRNSHQSGHYFFSSMGGVHLLLFEAVPIESMRTGEPADRVYFRLQSSVDATLPPDVSSYDRGKAYTKAAEKIIFANPRLFVIQNFLGAVKLLGGTGLELFSDLVLGHDERKGYLPRERTPSVTGHGTIALMKSHRFLIPVEVGYALQLCALYLLFIRGLYRLIRSDLFMQAAMLGGPVLYYLVVSAHVRGYHYRLPMMLFLAAGAGFGWRVSAVPKSSDDL